MSAIDYGIAVEKHFGGPADHRRAGSYAELVETWKDARPVPTDAQLQTAWAAYEAGLAQASSDAQAARTALLTAAQGTVGIALDQLTLAQLRALVGCLLYKEGALTADVKIRPLAQWVKP